MDLTAVNGRSKAAAWAWYQRTSGSVTARSEVALAARPHRGVRGGPSRFKLEADLQLLSTAPIQDTSDRLESLHLSIDSSNPSSDAAMGSGDISMAQLMTSKKQIDGHPFVCTDLVVAAPYSYGAAAWDCGSALFDSFELVAMAKKLDDAHQLNQVAMEKVCPPAEDASAYTEFETGLDQADEGEEKEEQSLRNHKSAASLTVAPVNGISSSLTGIEVMHRLSEESNTVQLSTYQMQSRQAIYDMFCRFDNPETASGVFSEDRNLSSTEHMRKPKPAISPVARSKQYRRRRLHSLSRAFRQHIAHLAGHSRTSSTAHQPLDKPCLHQSLSLQAVAPAQLQHQSHSLPAESTAHPNLCSHTTADAVSPQVGIKSMGSPFRECPTPHKSAHAVSPRVGMKSMGSPFRECPPSEGRGVKAPSHTLRKQYSIDSVHHHYHHHYHHHHHHYLFRRHSDEGFTRLPEPLLGADKSLLVAAAGLRMANISSLQDYLSLNPKLEGALIDYKRKLKDANMSTASPIQSPSHPSSDV